MPNHFIRLGAGIALAAMAFAAQAQSALSSPFPNRPLTLVVPFAAGASADAIARAVGRELSTELGQPVVVDNRPGAGGALGLMAVARAPADGYTLGLGATGAIAVGPHLPDAPPLHPQRDLAALGKLADIPLVLVAPASGPLRNLKSFLAQARKAPGGLAYAHTGQYTAQHLAGELLASMAGVRLTPVPYKGSGPAVTDLLGGNVPVALVDLTSAYPHIKAGKLVALGVTSAAPTKVAPEIAAIAQEGVPDYSASAWMGLFAPARTPAEIRSRLSSAVLKVMELPSVQSQITRLAAEPAAMDAPAFEAFIERESQKWGEVVRRIPAPAR